MSELYHVVQLPLFPTRICKSCNGDLPLDILHFESTRYGLGYVCRTCRSDHMAAGQKRRYERQEERDRSRQVFQAFLEKETKEEREIRLQHFHEAGRKGRWANVSDEERKAFSKLLSEKARTRLASLTQEEKDAQFKNWKIAGREARWANATDEDRKAVGERIVAINRAKWATMTPEERQKRLEPLFEGCRNTVIRNSQREEEYATYLKSCGIQFLREVRVGKYRCDFFLPDTNTIVEIYGCYWHQCEACGFNNGVRKKSALRVRQMNEDREKTIISQGYTLKVIWEHQMKDNTYV